MQEYLKETVSDCDLWQLDSVWLVTCEGVTIPRVQCHNTITRAQSWLSPPGNPITPHCTVKHHTDIINFACMTWNFVRIPASLSALCTNFERRKEKFNPRSPVSAPGDQSFRQIWFSFYAEKKLFVCRKNIWTHLNKQQMETLTSFNL